MLQCSIRRKRDSRFSFSFDLSRRMFLFLNVASTISRAWLSPEDGRHAPNRDVDYQEQWRDSEEEGQVAGHAMKRDPCAYRSPST